MYIIKEKNMERKQINTRLKITVIERLYLIAKQEKRTIQDLMDEIIELGIISHLEGGYNEKTLYKRGS